MSILVTGCAGFIASNVCRILLADGETVEGVDNLNDAYDVRVKHWRLDQLKSHPNFRFHNLDISDNADMRACRATRPKKFCKALPLFESWTDVRLGHIGRRPKSHFRLC